MGEPATVTGSAKRSVAVTVSPAAQLPSASSASEIPVTPGAAPKPSAAALPSSPDMVPPLSFSPDAATRTAPRLPSASVTRQANASRAVPEPEVYAARRIVPAAISASVGVPPELSTVTGAPNVTAASTVSPSVYTPSAPGSETTDTADTDTGASPFVTGMSTTSASCLPSVSHSPGSPRGRR